MTAPPQVYVYEAQLRSSERHPSDSTVALVSAHKIDNGEVFHLRLKRTPTHVSGESCRAVIQFSDQLPESTQQCLQYLKALQAHAPEWLQSIDDHTLFLFADTTQQKPVCKAFLLKQPHTAIDCNVHIIFEQTDLHARHSGLLETSVLQSASVGIIGVGSGGSTIAVELAKAGIGRFVLIDPDRLELGNLSRHACGMGDLGRCKTKAVADLLRGKNPDVQVGTIEEDINQYTHQFEVILSQCDLLIGATDNNRSRFNINAIALHNQTPVIFGRALTRASGGDVLRVRPFHGPCLSCVFSSDFLTTYQEELSQMRQARSHRPAYVSDSDVEADIQVGLSSDIMPIANMVVKMALLELSRNRPAAGIASLQQDLVADFYIWANRREQTYADWPVMSYGSKTPSILRWYGAKYQRNADCPSCGEPGINHSESTETDDSDFFAPVNV